MDCAGLFRLQVDSQPGISNYCKIPGYMWRFTFEEMNFSSQSSVRQDMWCFSFGMLWSHWQSFSFSLLSFHIAHFVLDQGPKNSPPLEQACAHAWKISSSFAYFQNVKKNGHFLEQYRRKLFKAGCNWYHLCSYKYWFGFQGIYRHDDAPLQDRKKPQEIFDLHTASQNRSLSSNSNMSRGE